MEVLKFCTASIVQLIVFFFVIWSLGSANYKFKKAIRLKFGAQRSTKLSTFTVSVFLFFMSSFIFTIYEISTLVLSRSTITSLGFNLFILFILGVVLSPRLSPVVLALTLPGERVRSIMVLAIAGLSLLSIAMAIEVNFLFSGNPELVKVTVETVKPARLSSPIRSIRVSINQDHKLSKQRFAFFRYDSRKTSDLAEGQTLTMELRKGVLGLYRLIPGPGEKYLKGNMFDY